MNSKEKGNGSKSVIEIDKSVNSVIVREPGETGE